MFIFCTLARRRANTYTSLHLTGQGDFICWVLRACNNQERPKKNIRKLTLKYRLSFKKYENIIKYRDFLAITD